MYTFIPFFHLCSDAFQTIFAMNDSLEKMKGHFTFWARLLLSFQLFSMGSVWRSSIQIPTEWREGALWGFFPLHHASFHLIKWAFQGRHVHSKIGRKRREHEGVAETKEEGFSWQQTCIDKRGMDCAPCKTGEGELWQRGRHEKPTASWKIILSKQKL